MNLEELQTDDTLSLAFSQPAHPLGDPPDSPESLSIALKRLESEKIPVPCGAGTKIGPTIAPAVLPQLNPSRFSLFRTKLAENNCGSAKDSP